MACVVCAAPASVYCENDKALLCKDCDVRIHMSNAVAARHVRRVPCEGGCSKGASLFCRCDNAHMCEACHSTNPLSASHEVEPVAPLPPLEQEMPVAELLSAVGPCESVAQSAASPVSWFVDDDKPCLGSLEEPPMLSPSGSEAVVPVMSAPIDEYAFTAPATFKEIKDKLEFESLELDNAWMDMGFDFTDILSDAPSDAGLVPNFDVEAAEAVADALVPSFPEEVAAQEADAEAAELSRKRAAEASEEEPAAKLPAAELPESPVFPESAFPESAFSESAFPDASSLGFHSASQMPQPASAMFFQQMAMLPPQFLPAATASAAAPAAAALAPKSSTAAYNAALAAGANLTREQRVARYREKRKNRKFEKTIRYASRKAYAEIRPRIKGRFAKKEEIEAWKAAHGGEDAVVPEVLDCDF
ncbi:hypothetical protein PLESTB_000945100 [Pleodorina starrii]|uniref:Uncharacterized protein n=1 Tax=Pleodorina starrii TaxID=330485 RepID=A0A9W6F486_9CHLO|nr:hypothetical protein PLESTM_001153600 [Pleodorina starrii]GLC55111.1 hypothetical protein PLESTB_000945100 [Pleodorina starrii]GLC71134.1 hypothetical protein PLESTF_001078100 [Pleodorina starrii]